MERLIKLLKSVRPDIDFEHCNDLVTGGRIESIDIVQMMSAIGDEYDIDVPPRELNAKNFNSAKAIFEMIQRITENN